jgi:hypothetical protein
MAVSNISGTNNGPNTENAATTQAVMATVGIPTKNTVQVTLGQLPTVPGVAGSGTLWNDGGVVAIS